MEKLSVLIPVYNEAAYVVRSLENVVHSRALGWKKEIIVVDDGSTDQSLRLIKEFNRREATLTIIPIAKNQGKGAAIKKAIQSATGDVLIIQDADLEYDPNDYETILSEYAKVGTKVVYGSRIIGAKIYDNHNASIFFLIGGVMLTKIINIFFNLNITDQPTCYKSWRKELSKGLLKSCRSSGFEFEVEMTAFFSSMGSIREVPIHYFPRSVNNGKKIKMIDFVKSVLTVLKCRFLKAK